MFMKFSPKGKLTMLIVNMDTIILTRDDLLETKRFKKVLAFEFEIKDSGSLRHFLPLEITHSKKGIVIS